MITDRKKGDYRLEEKKHSCDGWSFKFLQLWNAVNDARLTVECRSGKATIKLQLTLREPPPPQPACQVRPQPRRPGPSYLRCQEQTF